MAVPKPELKPLAWLGDSLKVVKSFPADAKKEIGHELSLVQAGNEPSDWKPMETVGAGVKEIRIRLEKAYRVMYVAKSAEAIYVLHAFEKKTRRTRKEDIDLANRRHRELLNERKRK